MFPRGGGRQEGRIGKRRESGREGEREESSAVYYTGIAFATLPSAMPGEKHNKSSWHGDMAKARDRIQALAQVLGAFPSLLTLLVSTSCKLILASVCPTRLLLCLLIIVGPT